MRRTVRFALAVFAVVAIALTGTFVYLSATSAAPSLGEVLRGGGGGAGITAADGVLPDGTTAFDDEYAGVANVRPDVLAALRAASVAASRGGVELFVNSGWRSRAYQAELLSEAVAEYGSAQEAARWVATPDTSPHVAGEAVDIGHDKADGWLSAHGAQFGLCQIYRNEPWHFELRPAAVSHGCPRMYSDPTQDPRMHER
jgi:D-alanyl-D-alanine carboxypeptidase